MGLNNKNETILSEQFNKTYRTNGHLPHISRWLHMPSNKIGE
jgi:hypothetical protein